MPLVPAAGLITGPDQDAARHHERGARTSLGADPLGPEEQSAENATPKSDSVATMGVTTDTVPR